VGAASATRSRQMARIRGRNTRAELCLRSLLWAKGLRYRLHGVGLPGKPDLVFSGLKTVVFVDGCFWHGCPEHYVRPRSRHRFWARKLRENVLRDRRQSQELDSMGWRVLRLWEHDVLGAPDKTAAAVEAMVRGAPRQGGASWRVLASEALDGDGVWERRVLVGLEGPPRTRVERHRRHTRKWKTPGADRRVG
jgi:DNA mismatch endonuclease (patch repair protein)